ncbi:MAG: Rho termination factor N-terminal domain-containing protein [Desulfobulbales bacterium]
MTVREIQDVAKKMGLNASKMKKAELVRMIQKTENNSPCFQTGAASSCGQENCLWLSDCK